MKTALLFPGQGIQRVGMGKDLYEEFPIAKKLYDEADKLLGFSLKEISFEGPQDVLTDSKNAQVSILLNSYVIFSIIKDKLDFSCVAGHSLGEYTAHLTAGTFKFSDTLHLVRFRGELMSTAKEGTMSAVIGLPSEKVVEIVNSSEGIVKAANFNTPVQTVITGEAEAVKLAERKLEEKGAKIMPLAVSGAFHSPLMKEISPTFRKVLSKMETRKPRVPVYSNVTGEKVTEVDDILETLGSQIEKPVLWVDTLKNMKRDGVGRFIEIGHRSVLTKMVKNTLDKVETMSISYPKDLKGILNE
ncbi:ACP S-malonyltransferase [candidate division WOR-3 bacterium]|nr:ACP S-malonyltransferase [candidate division WOR-3 bacterium]